MSRTCSLTPGCRLGEAHTGACDTRRRHRAAPEAMPFIEPPMAWNPFAGSFEPLMAAA
jgi:hypothetical protein